MEAYRIDRFGSVDGMVLRSSDDPRPRPEAVLECPNGGGLDMRLVASWKIPIASRKVTFSAAFNAIAVPDPVPITGRSIPSSRLSPIPPWP
jgi:hypothetical protein